MPADGSLKYHKTGEYTCAPCVELCGMERRGAKRACSAAVLRVAISRKLPPRFFDDLVPQTNIAAEENQPHKLYPLPLGVGFPYARSISRRGEYRLLSCRISSRRIRVGGFAQNIAYKNTGFSFLSNPTGLQNRKEIF